MMRSSTTTAATTVLLLLAASCFLTVSHAFFVTPPQCKTRLGGVVSFFSTGDSKNDDSGDNNNPCWQDISDDDCAMSNIYAASFVASKWIKSMPCAAGLEDCDMPEALKVPSAHGDPGVESVDVMGFLNLKRAEPVQKKTD